MLYYVHEQCWYLNWTQLACKNYSDSADSGQSKVRWPQGHCHGTVQKKIQVQYMEYREQVFTNRKSFNLSLLNIVYGRLGRPSLLYTVKYHHLWTGLQLEPWFKLKSQTETSKQQMTLYINTWEIQVLEAELLQVLWEAFDNKEHNKKQFIPEVTGMLYSILITLFCFLCWHCKQLNEWMTMHTLNHQ